MSPATPRNSNLLLSPYGALLPLRKAPLLPPGKSAGGTRTPGQACAALEVPEGGSGPDDEGELRGPIARASSSSHHSLTLILQIE